MAGVVSDITPLVWHVPQPFLPVVGHYRMGGVGGHRVDRIDDPGILHRYHRRHLGFDVVFRVDIRIRRATFSLAAWTLDRVPEVDNDCDAEC